MKRDIVETDQFVLFWGGWPSQWFKCAFAVAGVTYNCCEQYMMAEKARFFEDEKALAAILAAANPRSQKALGREVLGFDAAAWDKVSRGIVYSGNLARFSQDEKSRELLLATGEKTIVEASALDRIWGIGLAPDDPRALDPKQWRGTNWLGIALMQVREALRCSPANGPLAAPADADLREQLQTRKALDEVIARRR